MPSKRGLFRATALASTSAVSAQCNVTHINSLISSFSGLSTVVYNSNATTAALVSNYTAQSNPTMPTWITTNNLEFCNVTLSLSHSNLNDNVLMQFWLPASSLFEKRYMTFGGFGMSVSGQNNLPAGLTYGAVSGITDGGFGGFSSELTSELLSPTNGSIEWYRVESFGFQAIHEMTVTGKELTNAYYDLSNNTLKSYYYGCSEGGREGHMSTQRYPEDFDGVLGAAPAMYFPLHQLAQGWPNLAMNEQKHWPSTCAFLQVMNDTIAACDPLDGKTDGVVSRSDLCQYDASRSVGHNFTGCTAGGSGTPTSGTITQADADTINLIYKGAFDSNGDQIFWAYRNATRLTVEAAVEYNSTSGSWVGGQNDFFDTYVQNFVVRNPEISTFDYDDYSVDDVYQLMLQGLQDYGSWLETTWPDLSKFQARGGKLLHWHGEADTNLFPEASAHFHEKVRNHMFPNDTSYDSINEFYRFFIVPGAGHCGLNTYQPDGPFPQQGIQQLIDWVEKDIAPEYLNGTIEGGSSVQDKICLWPTRPEWSTNGTFSCVNETVPFIHPLNGWKVDY